MNTLKNLEVVTLLIIITIQKRNTKYVINLVKHRIFKLNDVFSEWVNCFTFKSFVDFPIIRMYNISVYSWDLSYKCILKLQEM